MNPRATSPDERINFSERLKKTLRDRNLSCRPSSFSRAFNARADGCSVTPHAARKWLLGEAIPTQQRIVVIARWLNVNAAWLRFGDAESKDLLAARGLASVLLTKDESELVQGVFSLSKPSQTVVQELVDSLLRLEGNAGVQKDRHDRREAR